MNKWKFLQPISTMEHVPLSELGGRLDELFSRCSKENIGFVLDDDHKSYVLCPAWWLDFCFDDDFGCIINSALRYAIGRHTYMPSVVVNFIRRYMDILDTKTLTVIIEDIEKEFNHFGGPDDPHMWRTLQTECKVTLEHKLRCAEGGTSNVQATDPS